MTKRLAALCSLALLPAAGCVFGVQPEPTGSSSSSSSTGAGGAGGSGPTASFKVRGSVEQVSVWKTKPATKIELRDAATDAVVTSATTDDLGSLVLRKVAPGDYAVVAPDLVPPEKVGAVKVTTADASLPDATFYTKQKLVPGFNYIVTRDGTPLSAYVTFPGPPDKGPYPTVVNYSGYDPSKPGEPLGNFGTLCDDLPVLCDAPSDPSGLIAALLGFATVSVNMRGTGCSGGAYDYFEPLQLLDGYDVIETVAAQDWALNHKVGMTGLSYPGITQMFVAKTRPPSLAAITPLSVIGNTYSTALPGGIFNDGFALEWITNVLDKAVPYGQGWEQARVDGGDTTCEDNQYLHSQKVDVVSEAKNTPYYTLDLVEPVNPTKFVKDIDVPVFLAGAWQDEQTGPYFFTLLDQFKASPLTRFTVYNGVHIDAFAPQLLVEWKAFLDIYVGHRVPVIDPLVRSLVPQLFSQIFKTEMDLPPDRFANYATWEEAKAAFEAEKPLRAIFENGGDTTNLGAPTGTFDMHFDAWPPAGTVATRFYMQPDGSLASTPPVAASGGATYQEDPDEGQRGILKPGGDVWDPLPDYDWQAPAAGKAVVFESAPSGTDLVMLGTGSVDLFVRSPVDDADLEVTLSEVRPDGKEMYIQSGWLRASLRKLAPEATELFPEHTYLQSDEALLVPGEWTPVRVGLAGFSHVLRAGSRIRISVDTPGGSRAAWKFALKTFATPPSYDIATNATFPSSLVLPVLAGVSATTPLPPCPSLRGQPCRDHVTFTNTPSAP